MDDDLGELLTEAAGEIDDVPIEAIRRRVDSRRRKRHVTWAVTAGVGVVALVLLTVNVMSLAGGDSPGEPVGVAPAPQPSDSPEDGPPVLGQLVGTFEDNTPWSVAVRADGELCVTAGEMDLGCSTRNESELVMTPRAAPRSITAGEPDDPETSSRQLLYGLFPEPATEVVIEFEDGSPVTGEVVMDRELGIWAMPVENGDGAGHSGTHVAVYLDESGQEVARYPSSWSPECPTTNACPDPDTRQGDSQEWASVLGEVTGTLADDTPWAVGVRSDDEFCITIGGEDLGCSMRGGTYDGERPYGAPSTASAGPSADPEANMYELLYGLLPGPAQDVVVVFEDGSEIPGDIVVDRDLRIWAMPVDHIRTEQYAPTYVAVYLDESGEEVASYRLLWSPETPR